jgi:hypothetical protein
MTSFSARLDFDAVIGRDGSEEVAPVWERVVVEAVHPGDWSRVSGMFLTPPLVAGLWFLHGGSMTGDLAVRILLAVAALWAVRWLMAHWYNLSRPWRGRQAWEFWISGPQLESVRTYRTLAVAAWAVPGAWLFGLALFGLGFLGATGGAWVWVVGVGGPVLQILLMGGTAGLYTRVVGGVSTTLLADWFAPGEGRWLRIARVDVGRARTVVATVTFAWAVTVTGASIALLMLGLTVLARHLPAGYFGLGVAIFVGFALAALGFVLATLMGLWGRWTAWLYNRWASRGGGLRWRVDRRSFPVG